MRSPYGGRYVTFPVLSGALRRAAISLRSLKPMIHPTTGGESSRTATPTVINMLNCNRRRRYQGGGIGGRVTEDSSAPTGIFLRKRPIATRIVIAKSSDRVTERPKRWTRD